jgi:hypothetical protein
VLGKTDSGYLTSSSNDGLDLTPKTAAKVWVDEAFTQLDPEILQPYLWTSVRWIKLQFFQKYPPLKGR